MKRWGVGVMVAAAVLGTALTGCSAGAAATDVSCSSSARNLRPAVDSFIAGLPDIESHGWSTEGCGDGDPAYLGFSFAGSPTQLGEELATLGCSPGDGDPVMYACSKGRVDFAVTTVQGDDHTPDVTSARAFMTAIS